MKGKTYTTGAFLTLTIFAMSGCSASFSTNSSTSNVKPAANSNAPANTTTNPNANTAKKTDAKAPTAKLQDAKKPEGEKGKMAKNVEVPKDWIDVYDSSKGYGFSLPDGSTGGQETQDGVDTFVANTPAPSDLAVVVITFKDKKMTKDDLLDFAVNFMKGLGATKVESGKLAAESEDYSLTEAVATLADGSKSKSKILVGTDVTDNYIMIVGTEEPKFAANEKTIDEIWGSFEMWSGGASGNN